MALELPHRLRRVDANANGTGVRGLGEVEFTQSQAGEAKQRVEVGNRDIACKLKISEKTAANHVRSILNKTGAANRTQIAMMAVSRRWVDGPTSERTSRNPT